MTRQRDPRVPTGALLPPLDAAPGPMPPLSAAEADAVAWGAVSRWAARLPGLELADDDVGPSPPLSTDAADRLARRALQRHARKQRLQPWALRAAAAALCVCGAAGMAFAAYRLWPTLDAPAAGSEPADSRRQRQSHDTPPQPPAALAADSRPMNAAAPQALETTPAPSAGPEQLLARANALRAQRRWGAAAATYRQVLATGASEPQRYVALVAAASIALQHLDKPARALALYQSALELSPRGDLSEDALYGSAECYRALSNTSAELSTLRRLNTEHPSGLLSEAAKPRRLALEAASDAAR